MTNIIPPQVLDANDNQNKFSTMAMVASRRSSLSKRRRKEEETYFSDAKYYCCNTLVCKIDNPLLREVWNRKKHVVEKTVE